MTSSKVFAESWIFRSDSNPKKTYETIRYTDGTVSCNCPGWTRRTAPDGSRTCKHCRLVYMGRAEFEAESHYSPSPLRFTPPVLPPQVMTEPEIGVKRKLNRRANGT